MRLRNRSGLWIGNSAGVASGPYKRRQWATEMSENLIEKRTAPRHRVLKHGTLAFRGGGGVDCMVRNISSNGARIDIANPVGLPESFTLVIEADQFLRRCHAVWSSQQQIGVAFD
jgi:hypothetical protein